MAIERYARYYMKSGNIIEVTHVVQINGYRFGDGDAPPPPGTGFAGKHRLITEEGRILHIAESEIEAIEFGPNSEPPAQVPLGFAR